MELESFYIDGWPFELRGIAYGQGQRLQLEVLYSDHHRKPNLTDLFDPSAPTYSKLKLITQGNQGLLTWGLLAECELYLELPRAHD